MLVALPGAPCCARAAPTATPNTSTTRHRQVHPATVTSGQNPVELPTKRISSVPLLCAVRLPPPVPRCRSRPPRAIRRSQPVIVSPEFARRVEIARWDTHYAIGLEDHEQLTAARVLVEREYRVQQLAVRGAASSLIPFGPPSPAGRGHDPPHRVSPKQDTI